MEKLIELINKYKKENGPEWISFYEKNGYLECQIEHYVSAYGYEDDYRVDMEYGVEILISKSFGFIKWLVENDKIDLLQLDNRIALSMSIEFNKVERVLMALSISDTPIDDLLLYLK